MPRIHDISVLLQPDMPTWPGEPGPHLEPVKRIAQGDEANVSRVSFGTHTGTHLDAPFHFLTGGLTVEAVPLEALVGTVRVAALDVDDVVTARHLADAGLPGGAERLLLKTRNSALWQRHGFQSDFVGLAPDAAAYLVDRRLRLVGIDYLSIEPFQGNGDTHRTLLEGGALILEGLDLQGIEPGEHTLICLPLKLAGADGSPVRAVLLEP